MTDAASTGGLITGYSLYVDDGYGGRFTEVFSSVGASRLITEQLVTGLTLSLNYRFYVIAYNYNHAASSPASAMAEFQVCTKPSLFSRPTKLATSRETIAVGWNEPGSNGGCSITGYAVLVDDGASGSFIEANADSDIAVR